MTLNSFSMARDAAVEFANAQDEREAGNTVDWLYRELRLMAINFRFVPWVRIDIRALAERFGVSRTPLRLALTRLTSDGFLSCSARKGFYRKPLDPKQIFDLYDFHRQIEVAAVRLALQRATDDQLAQFEEFVQQVAKENASATSDCIFAADEEFQERLCALTGNIELQSRLRNINDHLHYVHRMSSDVKQSEILIRHCEIAAALLERDTEKCLAMIADQKPPRLDQVLVLVERCYSRLYMADH